MNKDAVLMMTLQELEACLTTNKLSFEVCYHFFRVVLQEMTNHMTDLDNPSEADYRCELAEKHRMISATFNVRDSALPAAYPRMNDDTVLMMNLEELDACLATKKLSFQVRYHFLLAVLQEVANNMAYLEYPLGADYRRKLAEKRRMISATFTLRDLTLVAGYPRLMMDSGSLDMPYEMRAGFEFLKSTRRKLQDIGKKIHDSDYVEKKSILSMGIFATTAYASKDSAKKRKTLSIS